MNLKDNIYTLIESTGCNTRTCFKVKLIPDSTIFEGHFPNNPITPGVVMLGIVRELLEETTGNRLELKHISNIKYIGTWIPTLDPDAQITIDTTYDDAQEVKCKVVIANETKVFARMSLGYLKQLNTPIYYK